MPQAMSISNTALHLSILFLRFTLISSLSHFSPTDNYLINCGSHTPSTLDARTFIQDPSKPTSSFLHSNIHLPQIYQTSNIFTKISSYKFDIRSKGTHLLRFHFSTFQSTSYSLTDARFHVSANGYLLIHNFSLADNFPIVKEYILFVDTQVLVITFLPCGKSKLGFVNAIEVVSAPDDLVPDTARYVNSNKVYMISGLKKEGLQTVFRVTVGGPKVTPFNDSLWRTWVPDDEFLKSSDGLNTLYYSGRIKYQNGGANRLICPDNVYNTARMVTSKNDSVSIRNISWEFPIEKGYKYLVRVHFADIASISIGLLYFNVYLNGYLAYEDLDLSDMTGQVLASPFYADFLVDMDNLSPLSLSIGPSKKSLPHAVDAILNAVEIMKMNNSAGSFDGKVSTESLFKICERSGVSHVLMVTSGLLLVVAFVVIYRWMKRMKGLRAWSPLPVDFQEVDLKQIVPKL